MSKKPVKCKLNDADCLSLSEILVSFNAPINEEHAWALCYQCAKCFGAAYARDRSACRLVKKLDQVVLHKDGYVSPISIANDAAPSSRNSRGPPTEQKLLAGLGYVIFQALDFGIDEDEERVISPQLEKLLNFMIQRDDDLDRTHPETDDEGIEKDSGECEYDTRKSNSPVHAFSRVLEVCQNHVGASDPEEADTHYRAVCRALVAEVLEFSSFLEKVSEGTKDLRQKADTVASSEALDCLNFQDWARLWVQVIRELRHGVKLKKVTYSRAPVEYELTPYEILMEDIRSRRYKLNKVLVDGTISAPLKKDAHAIILEFIRSRPPLKKASERQLPPKRSQSTPRERLLESIKQGNIKLRKSVVSAPRKLVPYDNVKSINNENNNRFQQRQGSTRRLIKVDYSIMQDDDDDDDVDMPDISMKMSHSDEETRSPPKVMSRTAYDLATRCPSRRSSRRRHTICPTIAAIAISSPVQPLPVESHVSPVDDTLSSSIPQMSWSRNSLQEELFVSKQWRDECLSLTLEEIVHIRSVLTKAELESLPVEGHVKEDVEKRKVCFLCLKTRFSIFGPWGQICKLCKRTVCTKCYSKMRIPTEHFSHVPVVALSPTMLSPEETSFSSSIMWRFGKRGSVGSAPTSPKLPRSQVKMSASYHNDSCSEPTSLTCVSPARSLSDKYKSGRSSKVEKLKGLEMIVCMDCRTMVIQIIKSSRINRNNIIDSLTLDLTPVY